MFCWFVPVSCTSVWSNVPSSSTLTVCATAFPRDPTNAMTTWSLPGALPWTSIELSSVAICPLNVVKLPSSSVSVTTMDEVPLTPLLNSDVVRLGSTSWSVLSPDSILASWASITPIRYVPGNERISLPGWPGSLRTMLSSSNVSSPSTSTISLSSISTSSKSPWSRAYTATLSIPSFASPENVTSSPVMYVPFGVSIETSPSLISKSWSSSVSSSLSMILTFRWVLLVNR